MVASRSGLLVAACLVAACTADDPPDDRTDSDAPDTVVHTDDADETDLPLLPVEGWLAEFEVLSQPSCETVHAETGVEVEAPCAGCRAFRVETPAPCDVPWLRPEVLRVITWDGPGDLSAVLLLDPPDETGAPTVTANLRPAKGAPGEAAFAAIFDAFIGQGELRARVVGTVRFPVEAAD